MGNSTTTTNNGIGFFGLLTIVFIALKLIGKISWSWWWVLAPSWIPLVIALCIIFICLFLAGIVALFDK